jgi:hypothetical protein
MGTFLSLSGIIGKTQAEVAHSLANYARAEGGDLQSEVLQINDENCCVLKELNENTTILYPFGYIEWDRSTEFISKDLNAPVFSFHIHDGDLWMYVLFVNGELVDQFNPIPDYWEDISEEEINSWKGNAETLAKYIPRLDAGDVERYLLRWDLDTDQQKAYESDRYLNEDWQLIDFMNKLGLPLPMDEQGTSSGITYKLWTKELRLKPQMPQSATAKTVSKKWWKLW